MGALTDLYNAVTFGAGVYSIIPYFHITASTFAFVGLVFFIGAFIGALTWGIRTDLIGRRLAYIIDLGLMAVFAVLSGPSTSVTELVVFRFIMGFGLGGDYPAALTLLAEFSPKSIRGRMMTTFWVLFSIGGIAASLVEYSLFLHYGTSPYQW